MTILRAISAHNHRPLMRTIVQLIEPKNKQYLTAVGISEHNIVCINQLRMRIAAQARTHSPRRASLLPSTHRAARSTRHCGRS